MHKMKEIVNIIGSIGDTNDKFGICQRPVFSLGVSQHMGGLLVN